MSPRAPSKAIRDDLVATAARLIAEEGPAALTLRRVAQEVGTSTMAVYTHFGGMDELRRAVRAQGYDAIAAALGAVPETDDPLQDLIRLCRAYNAFAVARPDLYRTMFMEAPLDETDAEACAETFTVLVGAVARCVQDGALAGDPPAIATELWAAGHGVATLELSALLDGEQASAIAKSLLTHVLIALGGDPATIARAL